MIVRCDRCAAVYDDAGQWTLCPHDPLWAAPDTYCRQPDLCYCPICDQQREYTKAKHNAQPT